MARVPYVEAEDASLKQLYADIAGLRGSVLHLHKALASSPAALRAFMGMSRYVRDDAALPANLRELAIVATAYAVDSPYERHHHLPIARKVGVGDAQLAAFPDWEASEAFGPLERAVVAYADQVAHTRDVDDATFETLRRLLPADQLTDLVVTVAWYHLCAAILGPLRIEPEGADKDQSS
jgi:alkylhydroperoxidase family enzyme